MKLLLYSGILYLIVISVVLAAQPRLMFTDTGCWKEFGIGRDPEYYTWMPFWLFAIVSAILCYLVILVIIGSEEFSIPSPTSINKSTDNSIPQQIDISEIDEIPIESIATTKPSATIKRGRTSEPPEMKPGYYVLNIEETTKKGIPKYIFLGQEPPNILYNHSAEQA